MESRVTITGTGAIKFSEDEQGLRLRNTFEAGGLLFIDAAGGDSTFATEMQGELTAIFGDRQIQLSNRCLMGTRSFRKAGKPLGKVEYRLAARKRLGSLNVPQLKAIEINGKVAIVFSAEDVSAGIMGSNVDGIDGYTPASTLELVRRIVLSRN